MNVPRCVTSSNLTVRSPDTDVMAVLVRRMTVPISYPSAIRPPNTRTLTSNWILCVCLGALRVFLGGGGGREGSRRSGGSELWYVLGLKSAHAQGRVIGDALSSSSVMAVYVCHVPRSLQATSAMKHNTHTHFVYCFIHSFLPTYPPPSPTKPSKTHLGLMMKSPSVTHSSNIKV